MRSVKLKLEDNKVRKKQIEVFCFSSPKYVNKNSMNDCVVFIPVSQVLYLHQPIEMIFFKEAPRCSVLLFSMNISAQIFFFIGLLED